jgi:predicted nucleic acid-binding protein
VKYFFDTSVLVASVLVQHPQHGPSLAAYLKTHKATGCCAAHSIAEVYATMTRLPGRQRMSSKQALHWLDQTRQRFTIISPDEQDYYSAIFICLGAEPRWRNHL